MDAFDVPLVCYPKQNDIIPMIVSLFLVIGLFGYLNDFLLRISKFVY